MRSDRPHRSSAGGSDALHPHLLRQLRRSGVGPDDPPDAAALAAFLRRVDRAYREHELTRYTLERALDISTEEMRHYRERLALAAAEQIAAENDRRKSVISALDHGLVAIANSDEVLFTNEAAVALLGGEPENGTAVLDKFTLVDPRSDAALSTEQIWQAVGEGEHVTGTTGFLQRATNEQVRQELRPVWASVTPLVEGTRITGMVLLFDDSTERNETLESLARALQEARQAAETKSRFLANMSHEIRTPMNGVLGMLELVAHTELDAQQQHWISVARNSGDALLDIINEILDFSKLEAGRTELEAVAFDPAVVANDVVSLLGPRAQSSGLYVTVVEGLDLPRQVVGDPGRIRQVLLNLVGNAIKFTRHGGVRVVLDGLESRSARRPQGITLRFVVEDTGTGIPAERLEDLFAPFNQLDISTTRTFGGTGLGLTICRETVKLMNGNISVASEVGVGSAFGFTVPVEVAIDDAAPLPSQPAGDRCGSLGRSAPHLLVAEDNRINQILIRALLDHMGATYEVVDDGLQAVEAALSRPFTAILMDCQMPTLDGFDASRRLRRAGSTVPILALTANALAGDRERCLDAGMSDYLSKPLKMDHLRSALARLGEVPAEPRR